LNNKNYKIYAGATKRPKSQKTYKPYYEVQGKTLELKVPMLKGFKSTEINKK